MSKQRDEYRRYAAETLHLASRANSLTDKSRLLAMAEAWVDLADRADLLIRRQTMRFIEESPLSARHGAERQRAA